MRMVMIIGFEQATTASVKNELILATALISSVLTVILLKWGGAKRRTRLIDEGNTIIGKYSKHLGRDRFSHSYTDPYGIRRYDKWEKKGRKYFIEKVLLEEHSASEDILSDESIMDVLVQKIEETAQANEFSNESIVNVISGEDYEQHCEKLLALSGWRITRTPKTGDHGIDLIAERENHRVCLQCKHYSAKVGNSAIQEASAGKLHYKGTIAAVVSNNSFTTAAIKLAESNAVLLLHHSELEALGEILEKL